MRTLKIVTTCDCCDEEIKFFEISLVGIVKINNEEFKIEGIECCSMNCFNTYLSKLKRVKNETTSF